MSGESERVVLCEGYHDRAFLSGALLNRGCTDPGLNSNGTRRIVVDDRNVKVMGGQYAFRSKTARFIRVVPCGGKSKIPLQLRSQLEGWATKKASRIVVCVDDDKDANDNPPVRPQWVDDAVKKSDNKATLMPNGDWSVHTGKLIVSVATWWTADPHSNDLPRKQTLERLIVAAMRSVYADRAGIVADWLAKVGNAGPKEHAWSHMAGWYADKGCEGFCRLVWGDPKVADELLRRLDKSGGKRILDELTT